MAGGVFYLQHSGDSSAGPSVVPAPVIKNGGNPTIDPAAIYEADAPGGVLAESRGIATAAGPFGPERQRGIAEGSGFMIDGQGSILTNYHVVAGASKTTVTLGGRQSLRRPARRLGPLNRRRGAQDRCAG